MARMSDAELYKLNTAAVTKEYTVKPHLGPSVHPKSRRHSLNILYFQTIGRYRQLTGESLFLSPMMVA